jgi:hypothetical protein
MTDRPLARVESMDSVGVLNNGTVLQDPEQD